MIFALVVLLVAALDVARAVSGMVMFFVVLG
jgi:hypothetical protein